jgi:epoxyqueuosine reductase QueG
LNKHQIIEVIEDFTSIYPHHSETGWEKPLVAFARTNDPLFSKLKELASPIHELPTNFLKEAKTVITYFIPYKKQVIDTNRKGRYCSKAWALSYIETNQLIAVLNGHLQELLIKKGYKAVFVPATHNFDPQTLLSGWSHRSVAYIAGLGTFGVNHMLITKAGCCGRIGSLVTDLFLEATPRPHEEYCLHLAGESCGLCVKKCINHALTIDHLDKQKCYEMCLINADRQAALESIADVCGKCLVGVPCSTTAPVFFNTED